MGQLLNLHSIQLLYYTDCFSDSQAEEAGAGVAPELRERGVGQVVECDHLRGIGRDRDDRGHHPQLHDHVRVHQVLHDCGRLRL